MTDFELQSLVRASLLNLAHAERALEQARSEAIDIASYAVSRLCSNVDVALPTDCVAAKAMETNLGIAGLVSIKFWSAPTLKSRSLDRNLEPFERYRIVLVASRKMKPVPCLTGEISRDTGGKPATHSSKTSCSPVELKIDQSPAASNLAQLTLRQRQIMDLVLVGKASKSIAFALGISRRTVENHRALIMRKTRCDSIPALARLAFAATLVSTAHGDEPIQAAQLS